MVRMAAACSPSTAAADTRALDDRRPSLGGSPAAHRCVTAFSNRVLQPLEKHCGIMVASVPPRCNHWAEHRVSDCSPLQHIRLGSRADVINAGGS